VGELNKGGNKVGLLVRGEVGGKSLTLPPLFNIDVLKFGGIFDPKIMTNLYPLYRGGSQNRGKKQFNDLLRSFKY